MTSPAKYETHPSTEERDAHLSSYYLRREHELNTEDLESGKHRNWIGGMWEEMGKLQFEFLKSRGLLPHHKLLDVGCGSLRGGRKFIRYLDSGNYHGIDMIPTLIDAGRWELEQEGLADKSANLIVNGDFEVGRFEQTFDFALAQSLFTHLDLNHIVRCLVEVGKVLKPDGEFFVTFFEAPKSANLADVNHVPGGVTTHYDANPYHYSLAEMEWAAGVAGLSVEYIGEWNHPRNQRMLIFRGSGADRTL